MKTKTLVKQFSFVLFFVVTLVLYLWTPVGQDFKDHKQDKVNYEHSLDLTSEQVQEFSFDRLSHLEETDFFYTPYKTLKDDIVSKIDSAKTRVYMEMYILTEKDIISALKRAHKRGIDVKIILEQNVYKAAHLNKWAFESLETAGVPVIWDWTNYALTHTKLLLVDDEAVISTWNYSNSTFQKNRDFFIITKDKEIVEKSEKLFLMDYSKKKWVVYDDELVLSPYYSREKLQYMLDNAKEEVIFYAQNFSDKESLASFNALAKSWISVSWVIAWNKDLWNDDEIKSMMDAGVNIYSWTSPKIHAKALLIDKKYLYIWSINYSYYSIDKNRELGLIITNPEIISKFLEVYEKDVKKFVKNR